MTAKQRGNVEVRHLSRQERRGVESHDDSVAASDDPQREHFVHETQVANRDA
jgi:hypothetical protein